MYMYIHVHVSTCTCIYMYIHVSRFFHHQVPFVGFQPIRTSEHMAAAGKKIALISTVKTDTHVHTVHVRPIDECTVYVHMYCVYRA